MEKSKFGQKSKIWPKSLQINKIINVGFCGNSIDRSLVLVLKYLVYKLRSCTSVFKELNKITFFFFNFCCQKIFVKHQQFVLNDYDKNMLVHTKIKILDSLFFKGESDKCMIRNKINKIWQEIRRIYFLN